MVLKELGLEAKQIDKLQKVPAEDLIKAQSAVLAKVGSGLSALANRRKIGFNPVVDGHALPHHPFEPVAPKISANIPLMIGTNKDEILLFAPQLVELDEPTMQTRMKAFLGDSHARIVEAYRRARPNASAAEIAIAITSDKFMRTGSITLAERQAEQHAAPVFMYLFTWETPALGGQAQVAARAGNSVRVRQCRDRSTQRRYADEVRARRKDEQDVASVRAQRRSESSRNSELAGIFRAASRHDDLRQRMRNRE